MELNLKKLLPIGLIILAVMFVMKMMKGRRCEGFTQQTAPKVTCNCNVEKFSEDQALTDVAGADCASMLKPIKMLTTPDPFKCELPNDPLTKNVKDTTGECQNLAIHLNSWICKYETKNGDYGSEDECLGQEHWLQSNSKGLFDYAKAYCAKTLSEV